VKSIPAIVRRALVYLRASSARECIAYLIVSFVLSWVVWIPVLLAARAHERLGDLLILGTFGPSFAALMLSHRGVRVPRSKLSSRVVCFSLTLLLCWTVLMAHGNLWDELQLSVGSKLLLLLPSAIPAWIVSNAFSRDGGIRATMRSLLTPRPIAWHLLAVCLFPALLLLAAFVTRIQGGAVHPPTVVGSGSSRVLLVVVEFGYAFLVGGGVSEEPGWRGFLLPRLQDRFSPLLASLLAWLPWALWHAPLDFAGYTGSTFSAYLRARVFVLLPLTVIITWVYNRCGGTILSAALFHSAFNVAPDFIPSTKLAVWMVSAVALMFIFTDRMWRKPDCKERVNSCLMFPW
jgi:membrane protease YdiL (CAAX protease family)